MVSLSRYISLRRVLYRFYQRYEIFQLGNSTQLGPFLLCWSFLSQPTTWIDSNYVSLIRMKLWRNRLNGFVCPILFIIGFPVSGNVTNYSHEDLSMVQPLVKFLGGRWNFWNLTVEMSKKKNLLMSSESYGLENI